MRTRDLVALVDKLPRKHIGFYPTPFHRLENLSAARGVSVYLKREDLAGPATISGSKTRLAEFILGRALEEGVTHVITQGAHLTNSGMQFVAACRAAGIEPVLFLTKSESRQLAEYRGNLLMSQIMAAELNFVDTPDATHWETEEAQRRQKQVLDAMTERKEALEADGHKALIVPNGGAHPYGFAAHVLTFVEMLEQAERAGAKLDYLYHTAGTGTALPGLLAAKLLTGSEVCIRSVAIVPYRDDYWMNESVIVDRVRQVFEMFGVDAPDAATIRSHIDVDQRFMGEDYAVPSAEGTTAIRELARSDAVFIGPVYTGKGFAGMLSHIDEGRIEPGSNVAFVHTGDSGNIFESAEIVGNVAGT